MSSLFVHLIELSSQPQDAEASLRTAQWIGSLLPDVWGSLGKGRIGLASAGATRRQRQEPGLAAWADGNECTEYSFTKTVARNLLTSIFSTSGLSMYFTKAYVCNDLN